MKGYKYLDHKYKGDALSKGQFLLRRLSAYAKLENAILADDKENTSVGQFSYKGNINPGDNIAQRLKKHKFEINSTVRDSIFEDISMSKTGEDKFCLCLGIEPNNPHLLSQYDTVLEIRDLDVFADRVKRSSSGKLGTFQVGRVSYQDINYDVLGNDWRHPDPFVKRPQFRDEREIRIVWNINCGESDFFSISTNPDSLIVEFT